MGSIKYCGGKKRKNFKKSVGVIVQMTEQTNRMWNDVTGFTMGEAADNPWKDISAEVQ